ncbi:MAG TPA: glycosyltransferase family 39 protein [Longimicrobiales bacterium]|nr:glycosyltransferase family 39 protein [Longimicrobiales bacterium]
MPRHIAVLNLAILVVFAVTAVHFFPFTAEDAFITYRYAANFATLGQLVFNAGEPVLALTSPLHGLLATLAFRLTGDPVTANKVMSLAMLLVAAALVYARYRRAPRVQSLVLAMVLLPPGVAMWTFGGLETPILLLLVTAITLLAAVSDRPGTGRLCALLFLAGLAFLTRYDSVLFTAPAVLYALSRAPSVRAGAIAVAVGAALPLAWLITSYAYYGDIFPTSFYSKTPQRNLGSLIHNAKYVLSFLVFVGTIPVAGLVVLLLGPPRQSVAALREHAARHWWLYAGIAAQLLYGLTMATTHMMFSFRYFVPYIPATAILLGDLMRMALELRESRFDAGRESTREPARERQRTRRTERIVTAAVVLLVLFQALQAVYTYRLSVNGLARLNRYVEYGDVGTAEYLRFIGTLRRQGEDIRRHWDSLGGRPDRLPRVFTYAGGVVPFTFRESYVYETLVSYRHCDGTESFVDAPNVWMRTATDLRQAADYIHLITPRHGPLAPQLPLPEAEYELVSEHEMIFDGARERFLVFHNPSPEPHRLAPRIDGGCRGIIAPPPEAAGH